MNTYEPHVFVLPEDDANRQLADGFQLEVDRFRQKQMRVLRVARGWRRVVELFKSQHVAEMDRNPNRFMVLLIDLDKQHDRLDVVKADIPTGLADRVFVLGARPEPEDLKKARHSALTKPSVWRWRRIAAKKPIRFGGTLSFNTMQASLPVYASTFARSCSSSFYRRLPRPSATPSSRIGEWRN